MSAHGLRNRVTETAKLGLRKGLSRSGLALGRDPFAHRLARTLTFAGIDTVLDVGANVGQYATLLRSAGFDGRIISVEPLSHAYRLLERRASGDAAWTTLNSAVGAAPGTTQINISQNSFSSSLLDMTAAHLDAAPNSQVVGTEEVRLTTVAELLESQNVDPRTSLLKVDTQGYEAEVFAGAGEHLASFAGLQVELSRVELYRGQKLYDELVGDLTDLGFELWSLETGIADGNGRLLQVDGVFLRQDLTQ
jgi:FkbM family methyltransferase